MAKTTWLQYMHIEQLPALPPYIVAPSTSSPWGQQKFLFYMYS